jgi:hypothetical protein
MITLKQIQCLPFNALRPAKRFLTFKCHTLILSSRVSTQLMCK